MLILYYLSVESFLGKHWILINKISIIIANLEMFLRKLSMLIRYYLRVESFFGVWLVLGRTEIQHYDCLGIHNCV